MTTHYTDGIDYGPENPPVISTVPDLGWRPATDDEVARYETWWNAFHDAYEDGTGTGGVLRDEKLSSGYASQVYYATYGNSSPTTGGDI